MNSEFEKIREKDHAVLSCIDNGQNDVQLITEATTLNNSEVNYCFRKLSKMNLIEVEKPEGMIERVVNGTRQVFEAPKQAALTEEAHTYLQETTDDRGGQYQELDYEELVERVHELETDVKVLNQRFESFRKQISKRLRDDN